MNRKTEGPCAKTRENTLMGGSRGNCPCLFLSVVSLLGLCLLGMSLPTFGCEGTGWVQYFHTHAGLLCDT